MTERDLIGRIELAALWAWPPRETAWVEGWLLGAADGHTRRANSVRAGSFTLGGDLGRAVGRVEEWYAARGLPARFLLTAAASPAGLDATLAARGYLVRAPSEVLLLDPAQVPQPQAEIELATRPTALVMNALADPRWSPAARRARAALFARIARPHIFVVATVGGVPAAGGLGVVDGGLGGIFALRTQHPFRREGRARAVIGRLVAWLRGHGAERIYLQVEEANAAGRALFNRCGPELGYRYWYREGPASG